MPTMFRYSLIAAMIAICAGCGGSGGGSGGGGAPPGGTRVLGSRGVPGGSVSVAHEGPVVPGAVNSFRLSVGGGLAPTQVTAWIGAEDLPADAGILALPASSGEGAYDADLTVPSPLPSGSHVWVRLAFADGSVIETGAEDFPLGGH